MNTKRTICLLAALALAANTMPAAVYADTPSVIYGSEAVFADGFAFEENESGYTVVGFDTVGADAVIPEEYNGKPVNAIADGALFDLRADSLTVPNSVVTLGDKCLPENGTLIKVGRISAAGDYLFSGFTIMSVSPETRFSYFDLTDISQTSVDFPGVCSGRPPLVFDYDGTDHKQFFYDHLYNGTVLLREGTDYTVSYTDTTNVGKGHKAFTGIGDYSGVFYDGITINPADIKWAYIVVKSRHAYTGKAIRPDVTVKLKGMKLRQGTDCTITYTNNKNPGKAYAVITGKGNFTNTTKADFIIVPKKSSVAKKKALGGGKIKVSVKKDKLASGYDIQVSSSKKFTKKTTVRAVLGKNSKTSKTFTKLTAGRTYYIRSRAFIRIKGTRYFGSYSKPTKIKCR